MTKILNSTMKNDYELVESLKNQQQADIYLRTAVEIYCENSNPEALLVALRHIVEARGGVSQLAKKTHIRREYIYTALSKNGNPTLRTFGLIIKGLGYKIVFLSDDSI